MVVGNSHPHSVAHVGGWLAALGTGRADSHLSARMIGILGPAAPWPPRAFGAQSARFSSPLREHKGHARG